jgi:UDP-N-acetylmuramate--alanine ligase
LLDRLRKVHFVGIGGYGMSALAFILLEAGYSVSGSDIKDSSLTELLRGKGAKVYIGHNPEQLGDAQLVVYSTAIPPHNPEIQAAGKRGIPLWHRSELLAAVLNDKYGIAVAGTHGKTTTTAMLSLILEKGGLDPTSVIGGEVSFFQGNARLGKSKYIVAEACESDHSFLRYRPSVALVTNIEADHLEHYNGSFEKLVESYCNFINNVRGGGTAIICGDDPVLQKIRPRLTTSVLTYGFTDGLDIRGGGVEWFEFGSSFQVYFKHNYLGRIYLNVPGIHNALNALGAIAVGILFEIAFPLIQDALYSFKGAKRRFEIIGEKEGVLVVDDYAHHPTEIKATLNAARQSGRRLICVFQPHRFTRTNYLWDDFVKAFDEADLLLLDDIYSAGEDPLPGINSQRLAREISLRKQDGVRLIQSKEDMVHFLEMNSRSGDLILTMGAGDIWQVGRMFLEKVPSGFNLKR